VVIVVGLTGGIATGKSTVSALFEVAGALIVDADRIAREVVRKDLPGWRAIVAHFGEGILMADGGIDRKLLAGIVFNDPSQRAALNRILHPLVRSEIGARCAVLARSRRGEVVIVDLPLLFEVGWQQGLDEVILVYAPAAVQLQRLLARDRLTREEARARLDSQMPIEKKKALATLIIDNSGSMEHTRLQVGEIYRRLKARAETAAGGRS
jgi:dephospho-CoA kinase